MPELPLSYDVKIYVDRTWAKRFRWLPGGEPQDFTGWTAKMQVRQDVDSDVLLELNTEDGGITLSADGYIDLAADETQTSALAGIVRPRYDLVIRSDSQITTFLTGVVNVVPSYSDVPEAP